MRGSRRLIERHPDETLRGEVVDLVRLRALHQRNAGADVGQVVFDDFEVGMAVDSQFLDAPEVDRTRSPVGAVDLVVALQQNLGQVGAVLSRDACYDC